MKNKKIESFVKDLLNSNTGKIIPHALKTKQDAQGPHRSPQRKMSYLCSNLLYGMKYKISGQFSRARCV